MRRFFAAVFFVCLAQVAMAFDFPKLQGADPSQYDAARQGDPYAAAAYVQPLLWNQSVTDAVFVDLIGWLEWTHAEFKSRGEDLNAAWAAEVLSAHLWPRQKNHAAFGWAQECYTLVYPLTGVAAISRGGRCLEHAGVVAVQLQRTDEAIRWLGEARAVFRSLYDDTPEDWLLMAIANTLINEGTALDAADRHFEAIGLYTDALDIITVVEGDDTVSAAYAILNVGAAYWYAEDFHPARDWTLRGLPLIDRHEGQYSSAGAVTRINLALIAYDLGKPEEAMNWAVSVLPFIAAQPSVSLDHQRWTFELLRRLFEDKGQIDRAILFGKMAVNAQQEVRALNQDFADHTTEALREEWSRLYKDLAALMIREGRFSEAQAVLNMEKEQEAFEFLKRDAGAVLNETRAVLTDTELSQEAQLTALAARPVAAYEVYRALLREAGEEPTAEQDDQLFLLEDALAEADAAFRDGVDAFLAQVAEQDRKGFEDSFDATGAYQDILRTKERPTAILQLAVLEDATHVFLTLPGATKHATVDISRGDIRAQVFAALQAMERVDPEIETHMQGLYDLLLAPVREALEIAGTEVIMLNAGDVLRYVPFAALHDGERYIVEDFAFAQYVAAVPTAFNTPERRRDSAVGFGVTQAHGGFSALPGVSFEIEALFTATDGEGVLEGHSALDEGFDARALRRVLREPPSLLHIASHFSLLPGQVDDSFLLLGDGSQLPLSEFGTRRFNLNGVDLLTLSACQTAVGSGDGSEIDGMGVAALEKGASAVMASLWPVADAATPVLMRDFYEGLYGGGLDKAEALRLAQIGMLSDGGEATLLAMRAAAALEDAPEPPPQGFAHPYFWSAFIIMGNWL